MPATLGYHWVKSCYGLWLPGDDRGSWSEAWDEQLGFIEPHMLHEGDPVRLRMSQERMKHPPVLLDHKMIAIVAQTIGDCVARSRGGLAVAALAIEPTHMHVLIPYNTRNIDNTVKWLADQTTKAIHRLSTHAGPVWTKGRWLAYIFDEENWNQVSRYIRNHNVKSGRPADPYPFIVPCT